MKEPALNIFKQTTSVKEWIPLKYELLNYLISGDFNKGLPIGKMIELSGDPQTGKSTIGYSAIASAQALGGVGILVDTEGMADQKWLHTNNVNTDNLIRVTPESVGEAVSILVSLINDLSVLETPSVIVWDSLGATQPDPNKEFAESVSESLPVLMRAIKNSNFSLLILNQIRNIGGFNVTLGGRYVSEYASVRLQLQSEAADYNGTISKVNCINNKISDPGRQCYIYIKNGIETYNSLKTTFHRIIARGNYQVLDDMPHDEQCKFWEDTIKGVF